MAVPQIPISPAVLQELSLRAAKGGIASGHRGNNEAAQYLLFLAACSSVLDAAPREAEACSEDQIDQLLADGLAKMVDTIASLLPGGVEEMVSYLSADQQRKGWGSNSFR